MLNYFKKYIIFVCAIGIGLPVIGSTVWAAVTGTIMASTPLGLALSLLLLFVGLFGSQFYFTKKANKITDDLISLYNNDCDPEAFVDQARELAGNINAPYGSVGSWFMSYYAQALLDLKRADEAKTIYQLMQQSVMAEKKVVNQVDVIMNMVPITLKIDGLEGTLALINQAVGMLEMAGENPQSARSQFLASQRDIVQAKISGENEYLLQKYGTARANSQYPLRMRVEYAWKEAQIHYAEGDAAGERECLQFVAQHGNKLALVQPARQRLAQLS